MSDTDDESIRRIEEFLKDGDPLKPGIDAWDTPIFRGPHSPRIFDRDPRIPWRAPDLNYRPGPNVHEELAAHYRRRNIQLKAENAALRDQLDKIREWYDSRPKSASLVAAFTSVPRAWWTVGEAYLNDLSLPAADDNDEDPPTGPVERPNRDA